MAEADRMKARYLKTNSCLGCPKKVSHYQIIKKIVLIRFKARQ